MFAANIKHVSCFDQSHQCLFIFYRSQRTYVLLKRLERSLVRASFESSELQVFVILFAFSQVAESVGIRPVD